MLFALMSFLKSWGAYSGTARMRSAVMGLSLALAVPALALPIASWPGGSSGSSVRPIDLEAQQKPYPAEPRDAAPANAGQPVKPEQEPAETSTKPYVSRIVKEDGTITLRGHVPSDEDKKTIQGVIAATFPGSNFVDKAKVNANVPNRDDWLAGMNFALRQLAKLESGTAHLRDNQVSFEGAAKTEQDFKLMQQKLREEVPNGVVLGEVALKPPSVSPFVWLAQMQAGSVSLSGHVPLELDQDVFVYAKSLFGSFHVTNSMALALGAPKDWVEAAKLSLNILTLLQQGTVIVTDTVITVDGVLATAHTADHVKALSERLPKGFKLETSVIEADMLPRSGSTEEVSVAAKRTVYTVSP